MYIVDALLVSHFHATFRAVEVLLREQMHRALATVFAGPRWYADPAFRAILWDVTLGAIDVAEHKARAGRPTPAPGSVIAQVMLGTWVQLLGAGPNSNYDQDLWQPALEPVFQAGDPTPARTRVEVHALAQRLNWARNRVNHCEPVVFGFPLAGQKTAAGNRRRITPHQLLDDARAIASYIDPAVGQWISSWTAIDKLLAHPRVSEALEYIDNQPGIAIDGRR